MYMVSEYLKLEAEFHIQHTDRDNYLIETVVRGEEVSQRSKRLFKRMKVHLFHLNQLRSVSWIMTQLRMQQHPFALQ